MSNANESIRLPDGTVGELFLGSSFITTPSGPLQADRMHLTDPHGIETMVLIFNFDGKIRIQRIQKTMTVHESSPAVPATTSGGEQIDMTPLSEMEQIRLSASYHYFKGRSFLK